MADLRPQFNEEVVAHGHPTKDDVTNRAWNVEHDEDGTHKDDFVINDYLGPDCVDDTKIGDAKVKKEHINADIAGAGLVGGAGLALAVTGIEDAGGTELKVKIIEIGPWNMDGTIGADKDVAHGLTLNKIRYINIMIRGDTDAVYFPIDFDETGAGASGRWRVDATNVKIRPFIGGYFHSAAFDAMGGDGNRGWITIWYVV